MSSPPATGGSWHLGRGRAIAAAVLLGGTAALWLLASVPFSVSSTLYLVRFGWLGRLAPAAAFIAWCVWLLGVFRRLEAIGARNLGSAWWAVASHLVPGAGLVEPYLALQRLWRAASVAPGASGDAWRGAPRSWLARALGVSATALCVPLAYSVGAEILDGGGGRLHLDHRLREGVLPLLLAVTPALAVAVVVAVELKLDRLGAPVEPVAAPAAEAGSAEANVAWALTLWACTLLLVLLRLRSAPGVIFAAPLLLALSAAAFCYALAARRRASPLEGAQRRVVGWVAACGGAVVLLLAAAVREIARYGW